MYTVSKVAIYRLANPPPPTSYPAEQIAAQGGARPVDITQASACSTIYMHVFAARLLCHVPSVTLLQLQCHKARVLLLNSLTSRMLKR